MNLSYLTTKGIILVYSSVLVLGLLGSTTFANIAHGRATLSPEGITLYDKSFKAELVKSGLASPATMAFIGPNDILVTEKKEGTVQRIVNGNSTAPLIKLDVSSTDERGLLGIATSTSSDGTYVFLYYTKCESGKTDCNNLVYRYKLDQESNKLTDPLLLLRLPAMPDVSHNGGIIIIGPNQNLYISIGDLRRTFIGGPTSTLAQNYENGTQVDGRAGILRITQDGLPVDNILGDNIPLSIYYAYGIRNSFGLDFDPVTGNLWDTENGPDFGDEINLVPAGFNGGWVKFQGIWNVESGPNLNPAGEKGSVASTNPGNLVTFNERGTYSPPEFTWEKTIGPTAIAFLKSDKLSKANENDVFVSDIKNGNIYHFKLNEDRTTFSVSGDLTDKVSNAGDNTQNILFATGFGGITDLKVGPDGYLYVLTFDKEDGRIYRIVPT